MASTYSPNLRLELIGTGEQQGTWGATTNTNLGTLLEQAIGGYVSVTVSNSGDTTLTTNNGSSDESRNMVINLTGTISASRNVLCPAIEKLYVVKNATTGGFAVTFKVSGQTGVSIPNGDTVFLYVNGTDAIAINGNMANQSSSNVAITGGTLVGVTLSNSSASNVAISNSSVTNATSVTVLGGSNSAPTIAAGSDTNTGIFFPGADIFGITTGGSERFRIGPNGQIGIAGANYGNAGQVIISNGASNAVYWGSPSTEYFSQNNTPTGTTNGAVWLNTYEQRLFMWANSSWWVISSSEYGTRGLFGGGYNGVSYLSSIDYIAITAPGNASNFGSLTVARASLASCSSSTRGIFAYGGGPSSGTYSNVIDYVTIASPGNATDFGDISTTGYEASGCSNGTRGIFALGVVNAGTATANTIEYITIATTGNSVDFGDLTVTRRGTASSSNGSRGLFAGGFSGAYSTVIDYVTIATTGNATNFGSLTVGRLQPVGSPGTTRGLFAGGQSNASAVVNVIDYVTIATTGNATDFGDLTVARTQMACAASSVRACFAGSGSGGSYGNVIDYVTVSTTGNATDFGDLRNALLGAAGLSSFYGG